MHTRRCIITYPLDKAGRPGGTWQDSSSPSHEDPTGEADGPPGGQTSPTAILPEVPLWVPGSFLERSRLRPPTATVSDTSASPSHIITQDQSGGQSQQVSQPGALHSLEHSAKITSTVAQQNQQQKEDTPTAWRGSFRGYSAFSSTLDRAKARVEARRLPDG